MPSEIVEKKDLAVPKPKLFEFLDKIKPELKILIVLTVIFLGLIYWYSKPVPNLQYINSTNPAATPEIFTGAVPEGYTQILRWNPNDFVPNNNVPLSLIWAYGIFIVLLVFYITNKKDDNAIISDEDARKIVINRWAYWKSKKLVGNLNLYDIPQHTLKMREDTGGKRVPVEWIIPGEATTIEGQHYYLIFGVNPFDGQIVKSLSTNREFSRIDKCPKCGDFSDIKVIEAEELQRLQQYLKPQQQANK